MPVDGRTIPDSSVVKTEPSASMKRPNSAGNNIDPKRKRM